MERETITRTIDLGVGADELWHLISDRAALESWLGDSVDVDLRPGATGTIVDDGRERRVSIRTVEPGTGWSYDWRDDDVDSHVTIEITSVGDTSRLTITETLSGGVTASASAARALRWDVCLVLLWACTTVTTLVR